MWILFSQIQGTYFTYFFVTDWTDAFHGWFGVLNHCLSFSFHLALLSCWWLILRSDVLPMKTLFGQWVISGKAIDPQLAWRLCMSLMNMCNIHQFQWEFESKTIPAGGAGSLVSVVAVCVSVSRNTWYISSLVIKSVGSDGSHCSWILTARLKSSIISVMWLPLI